jgi:cytochrome b6-f complex iron-sulfur subunit
MDDQLVDRREFISKLGQAAVAAGLIAPIIGSAASVMGKPKPTPMEPIVLDLTKPEYAVLGQVGGALKIPDPHDKKKPIIVIRISKTHVAAFSSKCTHLGCEVPLPVDGIIKCPCHGSVFDAEGKVTHGPAKKNLYAYSASLNQSMITIQEIDKESK